MGSPTSSSCLHPATRRIAEPVRVLRTLSPTDCPPSRYTRNGWESGARRRSPGRAHAGSLKVQRCGIALVMLGAAALIFAGIGHQQWKTSLALKSGPALAVAQKNPPFPPIAGQIALLAGLGMLVLAKRPSQSASAPNPSPPRIDSDHRDLSGPPFRAYAQSMRTGELLPERDGAKRSPKPTLLFRSAIRTGAPSGHANPAS